MKSCKNSLYFFLSHKRSSFIAWCQGLENYYSMCIFCFFSCFSCFLGEGRPTLAKSSLIRVGLLWIVIPVSEFPHKIGWNIYCNYITVQMPTLLSPTSLIPFRCCSSMNYLHTNLLESVSQGTKSVMVIWVVSSETKVFYLHISCFIIHSARVTVFELEQSPEVI